MITSTDSYLISWPREVPNENNKDSTVRSTRREQLMSCRLRQKTHRCAKQQRENNQDTYCIESVPVVVVHCRSGDRRVRGLEICEIRDRRCACEVVENDHWDHEQDEDDESYQDVDEFVDAGTAVECHLCVICFCQKFGRPKVLLLERLMSRFTSARAMRLVYL
jgi:hypothetical protein